jgi:hypothetical protein
MSKSHHADLTMERPCQHRLANVLIKDLGFENAIDLCIRKGWMSALEMIRFEAARF